MIAVEIGAAVDDRRRGAAMLQRAARPRRQLVVQMPANPRRADEAQKGDARIGGERSASSLVSGMKVWHQLGGSPASCSRPTKSRQESGVGLAGLTITGQPTAIAGAT